jgi:hypothetical protein
MVRELLRVKQEVFMPLIHRPGEAQVDFGYALAKVAGEGGRQSYSGFDQAIYPISSR